jgi:hypothetical protein
MADLTTRALNTNETRMAETGPTPPAAGGTQEAPVKIIFLDFDGVLVNRNSLSQRRPIPEKADAPCVAALNAITDATGAKIVVSSTWRIGMTTVELRELLKSWGVTGQVIDRTPCLNGQRGSIWVSETRGKEIQTWIDAYNDERGEVGEFVILDDDADMDHLCDRLVQTEFEPGLTTAEVPKAIAMLTGNGTQHSQEP